MNTPNNAPIRLQDAIEQAPTLAQLSQRATASAACLRAVQPLLPPALRSAVRPGNLEDGHWCLLVPHNAAAAKLRQLVPTLVAALQSTNHPVNTIRIKVERASFGP
ncbi:DciA family protein [Ottowia sp.]|uniref:DciA family protein n=1 Tax=Ottowia sp. TaxID=1898956 RepID=UPI003A87281A